MKKTFYILLLACVACMVSCTAKDNKEEKAEDKKSKTEAEKNDEADESQKVIIPEGEEEEIIDEDADEAAFKTFSGESISGADVDVQVLAGNAKVFMIDFWASWCPPCREEMPNVKAVYEKYRSQGFEVIGCSVDQDEDDWKQAINELGLTWTQMRDVRNEGSELYGVQYIPYTVLVKNGKVVATDVRGEELESTVAALLAE